MYGNNFVNVEISWNVAQGIYLWINGVQAGADMQFERVTAAVSAPGYCTFGKPMGRNTFAEIAIADLNTVFAPKLLLNCFNVDFGKSPA